MMQNYFTAFFSIFYFLILFSIINEIIDSSVAPLMLFNLLLRWLFWFNFIIILAFFKFNKYFTAYFFYFSTRFYTFHLFS